MTTIKNSIKVSLIIIEAVLRDLSEQEIQLLIEKKGKISFTPHIITDKQQRSQGKGVLFAIDVLNSSLDRSVAKDALSAIPSKNGLLVIAKKFKLHVAKADRRVDIENKIIEFVIGAKLRTEAISSLDMKSGGASS